MHNNKNPKAIYSSNYTDIPEIFYSSNTNQPIQNCISCNKYLLIQGSTYVIEKAIKQYKKVNTSDVIFEYAMCTSCYEKVRKSFSLESQQRIQTYFTSHVHFDKRRESLLQKDSLLIDEWISSCIVKGTDKKELEEFQIAGQFDGAYLLYHDLPFIIGLQAMDEMAQLLSNKTLDEINGFYKQFFGPPPEIEEIFNKHKWVLL